MIFVDIKVCGCSESNLKLWKTILSQDIAKIANQSTKQNKTPRSEKVAFTPFPRCMSPDGYHHKQDAHLVKPLLI